MEIERKFLLKNSEILKFIYTSKVTIFKSKISQFYTEISPNDEVRYRKKDELFYLTTKKGSGLCRDEFEVVVSKDEFKDAYDKKISANILKDRYSFILDDLTYYVDIYKGSLGGLCILEIEFVELDKAEEFSLSDEISNFIQKDVTKDIRFKNKNLALYGSPELKIDLERTLNLIKKSPNLNLNFPSYIDAYQGLRLLLNQIYINLNFNKDKYLKTKNPENLHQFRVNLRKIRSILKSTRDLYDKDSLAKILDSFKIITKSTNQKRDFDVFIEYLKGIDGSKNAIDSLKFVSANQNEDFLNQDNEMILLDFEGFLGDESGFYSTKCVCLKQYISKVIRKEIVSIEKYLLDLSVEVENKDFHKTRIELKKLRYLLESFGDMFELKSVKELFQKLKDMQEIFGKLQDRDAWCDIIDMYDKGELGEFLRRQKSEIWIEMFELRGEILDNRAKFLKHTRRVSKILKAYY